MGDANQGSYVVEWFNSETGEWIFQWRTSDLNDTHHEHPYRTRDLLAKPVVKSVYLVGSLRNPEVQTVARTLRSAGYEVFDDWVAAGPEADDYWQKYEKARGSSYPEALAGYSAQHVYHYDKEHLDRCDVAVLVLPAGKSGHLELGYAIGKGKRGYILLDKEPERFDVMYNFATKVVASVEELLTFLKTS